MVYNPINFGAQIIKNWEHGTSYCRDCPLRKNGKRYTPIGSLGYKESEVLFVGQNPGAPGRDEGECVVKFLEKNKDKRGKNLQKALVEGWKECEFGGDYTKNLKKILSDARINFKLACFTNVARCSHLEDRKITSDIKSAYEKCSNYLKKEIEQMNPKLIVALGRRPSNTIYDMFQSNPPSKNLKCYYGKKKKVGEEYNVISVYHPTSGLQTYNRLKKNMGRNWRNGKEYEDDLRDILRENLCNL